MHDGSEWRSVRVDRNIPGLLSKLWGHINLHRRRQFVFLLVLMAITSFAEVLSIGAILPFLGIMTAPEKVFQSASMQPIIDAFNLTNSSQLFLPLAVAFSLAALIAGIMRLLLLWASTRLSFAMGADLSSSIYRRTLYQEYEVHCARNSSELIDGISAKANIVIQNIILPVLTLLSSFVMLVAILIALLSIEPRIALSAFMGFGLIYVGIIVITRARLLNNSQTIARESSRLIKSLQEGLGGIRDILIDGSQEVYCEIYRNADLELRRAQAANILISGAPRYILEALGMILIAALAFLLISQSDGFIKAIPILGCLALGAQRLLPVLQQGYAAWSGIRGGQTSLSETLALLDQPLPEYAENPLNLSIPFKRQIHLAGLSFQYKLESSPVLNGLEFTINKGERVGFIGATGSGKSTLLDILMGLLFPSEGHLIVDGQVITKKNFRGWQSHISHVPQAIYLADTSIAENIAFGISAEKIDFNAVRFAAERARLSDVIDSWPNGYDTLVGEKGVRLSGGQRQRIGIARALYKKADVIILDEATSALDTETELSVMSAIENLDMDLTVIIVAHRLSTLRNCTRVVEIAAGKIARIGSYEEIIGSGI